MATKRAMATATRVVSNKEGNGKGSKGDGHGNRGAGRRAATATATERALATATRVAGDKEGNDNKESNGTSDKGSRQQREQWLGQQGQRQW